MTPTVALYHGNCTKILPSIESGSVDCVITDPPYPEISRDYGRMSESEWFDMMHAVVPEVWRVLKPTGSAVFILQPNSERVGRMRTWLWKFMAWVGEEYGIVQDAWWWNVTAIPEAHSIQGRLMRPSLKACVWMGRYDCYRNQGAVLWQESELSAMERRANRVKNYNNPSGHHINRATAYIASQKRGGVTPYNVIPISNETGLSSAGANGHGAGTPYALASWWTRYICPDGGTVLDPFLGSGTMGLAALDHGTNFIGIEQMDKHFATAKRRIEDKQSQPRQDKMIFQPTHPIEV